MALLADGFHMAALAVAAWAYGYARRHAADPRFSFGTGKVGDLVCFANALVLAVIALGIGVESVQRLFSTPRIAYDEALLIAVLGLVVNLASVALLGGRHQGHDHHHAHGHGAVAHDNNLRSAYLHVLADALTSVLAIAALLAGMFLGWDALDAAMGIVGAIVIGRWSYGLFRDTGAVLVGAAPNEALKAEVRKAVEDGDARVTDLHVWRVGPGKYAAIVSLIAADPFPPAVYAGRRLHEELVHVTVEPHPCAGPHPHPLRAA